ncbi:MAG TPA: hypothetical protein VHM25_01015, partial [Polyangiaceae bacterium]|nr:hypothetical protein [Polyangiaceae bacterium]
MRGLSLVASAVGVSVACGVLGCSSTRPGSGGVAPRDIESGGSSSASGGQGGSYVVVPTGGNGSGLIVPDPVKDAGPDVITDAGDCATLDISTVELVATVDLLVDTSGSMFQQPKPFWTPLYNALMDSSNSIVKQLEDTTRFGFTSYTGVGDSVQDKTTYKCPILKTVPYA